MIVHFSFATVAAHTRIYISISHPTVSHFWPNSVQYRKARRLFRNGRTTIVSYRPECGVRSYTAVTAVAAPALSRRAIQSFFSRKPRIVFFSTVALGGYLRVPQPSAEPPVLTSSKHFALSLSLSFRGSQRHYCTPAVLLSIEEARLRGKPAGSGLAVLVASPAASRLLLHCDSLLSPGRTLGPRVGGPLPHELGVLLTQDPRT